MPKPNYPQPEVTIPVESPGCADKTRRPVTLPDGTRATATPGCVRVDPSRLGQPGSRASTPAASPTLVPSPPSVCPGLLSTSLYYDRFGVCLYAPLSFTMTITTTNPPGSYTVRVDFTVKMWALLSNQSRWWVVDAVVTPTAITGLPAGRLITAKASLACTHVTCTTTPTTPADGQMGTVQPNVPMSAEFIVNNSTTTATLSLNNTLSLDFTVSGVTGPPGTPARASFGTGNPIRCDNAIGQRGFEQGCVVHLYRPAWQVSDALYPAMGLVAKHMAKATGNLAGVPGLPGQPGGPSNPLTFIGRNDQNYQIACGGKVAPPAEAARGNTSCDEYPFASTAQGAASGGPYSICWVKPTSNDSQGGAFNAFTFNNRVLVNDQFHVYATYSGTEPGCDTNLGGGGSVAPNQALNNMFNVYGDYAGCDSWGGGDATNSVVLPSGKRAWFFSDTFLNSPAARRGLWFASGIHNSIVIQDSNGLSKTITGGNTCQEQNEFKSFWDRYALTPAASTVPGGFYWTGDQMLVGSNVVKFYYHGTGSGSNFTMDFPAVASIAASSLENNSAMTINPVRFSCGAANIIWGVALLNWNGNVYVYGWRGNGSGNDIYLARTTGANLTNPGSWQLYTGMSGSNPVWGGCGGTAAKLPITNGTTGFSVASINGGLWLVQFDYTNGQLNAAGSIGAHPSSTPWGFTNQTVSLYTPPTGQVTYPYYYQQYEARVQPGLGATGQMVISYSVNTLAVDTGCVSANAHDASIYRPRFIDVPVSKFNAANARIASGQATATRAGAATTASPMAAQGIHHAGPPIPTDRPPAATATSSPARSSVTGIDGVTDWYKLSLGGSCPSINAPSAPSLSVDADGIVTANWSNVGTDVWYYPYVCDDTTYDCTNRTTTVPYYAAWPTPGGPLWTTGTSGELNPIALTSSTEVSTNGHTFAVYIRSFGAGNSNNGGNSPTSAIVVRR
jgi:hypothetical protein